MSYSIIKKNMYNALILNHKFFVKVWPIPKNAVSLLCSFWYVYMVMPIPYLLNSKKYEK